MGGSGYSATFHKTVLLHNFASGTEKMPCIKIDKPLVVALNILIQPGMIHIHIHVLLDFSLTVKAAPYACVIRTGQP